MNRLHFLILPGLLLVSCSPKPNAPPPPVPTPSPTPTPTPLPTPVPPPPTPTPRYGTVHTPRFLEQFEREQQTAITELSATYLERLPAVQIGGSANVRLEGGRALTGTVSEQQEDHIVLQTFTGMQKVRFRELDAVSRFAYDPVFRDKMIKVEAALVAYRELSPSYRMDELDLSPQKNHELGNPDALFQDALSSKSRGDTHRAFFLLGILSREGRADAQRELAFLYHQGQGVGINPAAFQHLIRKAAANGDVKAQELVAKYDEQANRQQASTSEKPKQRNEGTHQQQVQVGHTRRPLPEYYARQRIETPSPRDTWQREPVQTQEDTDPRMKEKRGAFDLVHEEKSVRLRPVKINGVKYMGSGAQLWRDKASGRYFYEEGRKRIFISELLFEHSKRMSGK